jgi:hypothetical protein
MAGAASGRARRRLARIGWSRRRLPLWAANWLATTAPGPDRPVTPAAGYERPIFVFFNPYRVKKYENPLRRARRAGRGVLVPVGSGDRLPDCGAGEVGGPRG